MRRLAIIITHPIQYYAPIFSLLAERGKINIRVFYTLGRQNGHDYGFGRKVSWDIPLLDGYDYEYVQNIADTPGSHHYKGIVNPDLIQKIEDYSPDAVLVFGWAYHSHLKAICYFKNKVSVLFRGDSTLLKERKGIKRILKYIFLKWVYWHVDHAFYVGTNNRSYFKNYGLKDAQLSFAPHAVDNSRFEKYYFQEADQLRQSLNIKENDILILYAGKFERVKNVELLLSAFISLKKKNAQLLLVGNGILANELKKKAVNNHSSNIHFLDFKNQSYMPVLYQAADLLCLPSLSETWGLAVNEAMACSKAILVSDKVGCAIDLVKEGYNGLIFKSGDLRDLTEKLNKLTVTKDLLEQYGNNSKKLIVDWNFSKIAEAIENKLNATSSIASIKPCRALRIKL